MSEFNPNLLSFAEGLNRVKEAATQAGVDDSRIVTSRDAPAQKARELLTTTNVPDGFRKYELPVSFQGASQMFVTIAEPGAESPEHFHKGAGIRFIAGGSIIYNNIELTAGDWMYIPANTSYSFKTGPNGAIMSYCYECCCL